jgi:membrane-bound ClpP family serine protease
VDNVIEYFMEGFAIAMTGCIMALLGGIALYSTNDFSFVCGGKFVSKDAATVILIFSFIFVSGVSIFVESIVHDVTSTMSLFNITGLTLLTSRLTVNALVDNWNFDDSGSIVIYILGLTLFFMPE